MDLTPGADPNPRFQKIDKVTLLALCPLFSGLSQWELKSISHLMRLVEYRKDELVYREGSGSESFYVIFSGRFEASIQTTAKKKVLAYLRRGDYFGEMSLLTDEPHSATIRTLSDSLLLELKKEDFKKILELNASIALEIGRRLSVRLKGGADTRSKLLLKSDVISIFSNQHRIGRTAFSINLAASLVQETHQRTVLLDMSPSGQDVTSKLHLAPKIPITQFQNIENAPSDALLGFLAKHPIGFDILNVAHTENDSMSSHIIIPLLNHLSIDYRFILIDLPSDLDETVFKTLTQSDNIYFVTDSHINNITEIRDIINDIEKNISFPEEKISIIIHEVFYGTRTTSSVRKELFGKKICYSLPSSVQELMDFQESHTMPIVIEDPGSEYSRVVRHVARRVSNNLVGLALGSGAALGLAHIGVLKVLERENIPIDIISGSSIGALIGSIYAVNKNAAEVEKTALEVNSLFRLTQLLDINWFPVRALMDAKRVLRHFKSHLGDKTFEDCQIPLRLIGADLTTRQIHIFDSGYIADAVRTSIAIPAIFNPTFMNGDTMVDGGILSPLPIRVLHEAGANKIIAVNVFPSSKDMLERRILRQEAAEKEEMQIRQKNFLSRSFFRLKKSIGHLFFPNAFDILMNTIQAMETEIAEIESESADLVIRPVVANANWVDFFKPKQFIQRGEEEAVKMLPKIKALVSQQNV